MKPLMLRGRPLSAPGLPAICVPLVARDEAALLAEAAAVVALAPDLVEWRVDHFTGVHEPTRVLAQLGRLRRLLAGRPLLFTYRSAGEGGHPGGPDAAAVAALCRAVCEAGACDLIDYEMEQPAELLAGVRASARVAGIGLVLSFHDFSGTPAPEAMVQRLARAQALGADVAKLAVMPQDMADVLALLAATWQASRTLGIPVVTMAMGALGAASRVAGGAFGSAMTFARGAAESAPGQLPVAPLRAALSLLGDAGAPR